MNNEEPQFGRLSVFMAGDVMPTMTFLLYDNEFSVDADTLTIEVSHYKDHPHTITFPPELWSTYQFEPLTVREDNTVENIEQRTVRLCIAEIGMRPHTPPAVALNGLYSHLGIPFVEHPIVDTFMYRVRPWMMNCFGAMIASDTVERCLRFMEEATELVQSLGLPSEAAHNVVDYVYGREVGIPTQEVGGAMVTLAALCLAQGIDMHVEGEKELQRISSPEIMTRIREKQKAKPRLGMDSPNYPERSNDS